MQVRGLIAWIAIHTSMGLFLDLGGCGLTHSCNCMRAGLLRHVLLFDTHACLYTGVRLCTGVHSYTGACLYTGVYLISNACSYTSACLYTGVSAFKRAIVEPKRNRHVLAYTD